MQSGLSLHPSHAGRRESHQAEVNPLLDSVVCARRARRPPKPEARALERAQLGLQPTAVQSRPRRRRSSLAASLAAWLL